MKTKFAISLITSLLFSLCIATFINPVFGAVSFFGSLIPQQPGMTTMALQREVWLPSLQEQYVQNRDWMNGLSDLSQFVDDNQVLHMAEIGDYPTVYKNKTDDVDSVEPTETPKDVSLDTYDSQNYKIRKIGLYGIPYAKVEAYTRQSAMAIRLKEAKTCAYAIAPDVDLQASKKILIPTTGADVGTGYQSLTIADVMNLARIMDVNIFPEKETGRHLVLTSNMFWELIMSSDVLKAQIGFQQRPGYQDVNQLEFWGFKIHRYDALVPYDQDAAAKAAEGTLITGNIVPMSFGFCTREAWKGEGAWSMFDRPITTNTTGRAYEFGFQHRFKAGLYRTAQKYSFGIYSPKA